jgi:hypothetical protein
MDRLNHLASGLSLEELTTEASHEIAGVWYCQEPMPARNDEIDWGQLGESFLTQLLLEGPTLGI